MEVKQIYTIINSITSEITGKTDLVNEDLTNTVDVGNELFSATDVDNYVKKLVNHIGKVIFVNRKYSGNVPSMLMDSWEYGSVLEKITADIPEATENESWELVDKQEYKQDVFYQPKVSAKFFNKRVTFEVPMSFTERQVKESFSSANQLNGFMSMIYTSIENSLTVKIDSLIMRTINNMIGETIKAEFSGTTSLATKTGMKAVNLLKLYNDKTGNTLTADKCTTDADFIRFASYTMGLYIDRLSKLSTLFNVGKKERFTPADKLGIVLLSEFKASSTAYLESDTFHNTLVSLPNAETVPYWQGSGTDYSFEKTSAIDVKTASGTAIKMSGILGIMYDKDAMGVCNLDRRVTTNYNAKAEFFNNYYKFDAGYFNDLNENFVVFFVASAPAA